MSRTPKLEICLIYLSSVVLLFCAFLYYILTIGFYESLPATIHQELSDFIKIEDMAISLIVSILFAVLGLCAFLASVLHIKKRRPRMVAFPCILLALFTSVVLAINIYGYVIAGIPIFSEDPLTDLSTILLAITITVLIPLTVNLRKRTHEKEAQVQEFN